MCLLISVTKHQMTLAELVTLVNSLPENCKLHILFTHFENFIINKSLQFSSKVKFRQEFPFDWEENTQQAEQLFREFTETMKSRVEFDKEQYISWYSMVALHTNLSESLCNNDYPVAMATH